MVEAALRDESVFSLVTDHWPPVTAAKRLVAHVCLHPPILHHPEVTRQEYLLQAGQTLEQPRVCLLPAFQGEKPAELLHVIGVVEDLSADLTAAHQRKRDALS